MCLCVSNFMNGLGDHRSDSRGLQRIEVMLVMGIVLQNREHNKQEMARELLRRVNKGWVNSKYEVDQSKCILFIQSTLLPVQFAD